MCSFPVVLACLPTGLPGWPCWPVCGGGGRVFFGLIEYPLDPPHLGHEIIIDKELTMMVQRDRFVLCLDDAGRRATHTRSPQKHGRLGQHHVVHWFVGVGRGLRRLRIDEGFDCGREESNLHPVLPGPGPQPGASANSATSARATRIIRRTLSTDKRSVS